MKRFISILLVLILCISAFSISAFADATAADYCDGLLKNFDSLQDNHLITLYVATISQMYTRHLINDAQVIELAANIDVEQLHDKGLLKDSLYESMRQLLSFRSAPAAQSIYSFGQGIYVVGQDLQPGTYDIKCDSVADEGYSESIGALGDIYSGLGLGDYGSAFGSLGDIYETLEVMTINIQYSNGTTANYMTLKSGETARVILENGMKVELQDGTSTFTFVR